MLGLKPVEIFAAITIGSLLSSFLIGYSVYALHEYFDINVWYVLGGVIFIIIALPLLSYAVYKTKTGHRILTGISDHIHRLSESIKRE